MVFFSIKDEIKKITCLVLMSPLMAMAVVVTAVLASPLRVLWLLLLLHLSTNFPIFVFDFSKLQCTSSFLLHPLLKMIHTCDCTQNRIFPQSCCRRIDSKSGKRQRSMYFAVVHRIFVVLAIFHQFSLRIFSFSSHQYDPAILANLYHFHSRGAAYLQ